MPQQRAPLKQQQHKSVGMPRGLTGDRQLVRKQDSDRLGNYSKQIYILENYNWQTKK